MQKMLKAIIFDMDGVLVNSEPLHAKAAVDACAYFGLPVDTAYCYRYIGVPAGKMCHDIIEEFQPDCTEEELLQQIKKCKQRLIREEGYPPVAGVTQMIRALYKDGIHMAVASSSPHADIVSVTKALGIFKYFDHFISAADSEHPKPEPDIFLKALRLLGVDAKEAVVVEDSAYGCQAAKAAGIACLGLINPDSGRQELSAAFQLTESFENIKTSYFEQLLLRYLGQPVTIAKTRRLTIRELGVSDIPSMYQIYQNKNVRKFVDDIDDYLEIEIEKQKAYIKHVYGFYGYGLWGVFDRQGHLVGRCGIQNVSIDGEPEIELSYLLNYQHWGMGYALECTEAVLAYAFEELELDSVVARIDVLNERSLHLIEKLHMENEKTLLQDGRTLYVYRIRREDYLHYQNAR